MKRKFWPAIPALLMAFAMCLCACSTGKKTNSAVSSSPAATASPAASASPGTESAAESSETESGGAASGDADIKTIYGGVKEAYGEDYLPDRVLTEAEIEEKTGISSELYLEAYGESATLDEKPDIFLAFRAKSGKEDELKKKLEEYRTKLLSDFPDYGNKVKAAQVYSNGDHVFLVCLGKDDSMLEDFGEEIKKGIDKVKSYFE